MDRKQARENRGDENYDRKQFSLFMFGWNEMRGELFNLFEKRKEIFFGKRM